MIWSGVFLLAVGLAGALPNQKLHPFSDEFIQQINEKQSLWKAGRNFEIEDYDLFKRIANGFKRNNTRPVYKKIHDENEDVPDYFDSRETWSDCADIIGLIRDQCGCGSCWAFAAVETMSDRICIYSNAARKLLVSSGDLVTCGNAGGCNGGWASDAWAAWTRGIVTGGLYGRTDQGCKAYIFPSCDDQPDNCGDTEYTPPCVQSCDDASLNYEEQETYGKNVDHTGGEKQIQLEILKNGPVQTGMTVYEDFGSYQSGIYQHVQGEDIGGHYVKILGWGVENGVKYWLMANSWDVNWGENGYFRIIRGVNEVGVEDEIYFGEPDFDRF